VASEIDVVRRLSAAGCVAPEAEAKELLGAAGDARTLEEWLRRREAGEPLAWITGTTVFLGRRIRIDAGVYVPRPQTEELARRASDLLPRRGAAADLCAGAGAIAVSMATERPSAAIVAADIDVLAVACARANGLIVVRCDVGAAFRTGSFDVVACVPPYVPTGELRLLPSDVQRFEPRLALDGGADGLDVARRLVADAARLLRSGGSLLLEIGGGQAETMRADLDAAGFSDVESWSDDEGDLRGMAARRSRSGASSESATFV